MTVGISLFGIFSNIYVFLTLMILIGGFIGLMGKKLSVAAYGSYLVFLYIAQEADLVFYNNLLYLIVLIIISVIGFRLWAFYTEGSNA